MSRRLLKNFTHTYIYNRALSWLHKSAVW